MAKIFALFIVVKEIFTMSQKCQLASVLKFHDHFWMIYGTFEALKC